MDRPFHEPPQGLGVVNDLHGPSAQDIRRADDDGITDPLRGLHRFGHIHGRCVFGLPELQEIDNLLKALAVFRPVDGVGGGSQDGRPGGFQAPGQIQRGLPAELHDHAHGLFRFQDVQDVLERHGLEKQLVRDVIVGAHRFRVGIDHDALVTLFPQRKGGVHAAVVEFDALADPVRPAAQDHDFGFCRGSGLVLGLVGGIVIGREGLEFGGAGVHELVNRQDALFKTPFADCVLRGFPELGQAAIGETPAFRLAQQIVRGDGLLQQQLRFDNLPDLVQKPGVDLRDCLDFGPGHALPQGGGNVEQAQGIGGLQAAASSSGIAGYRPEPPR